MKKGAWTIEEDRKLFKWIKEQGPNNWSNCSEYIKARTGKQCRERWFNSLHPGLKKGVWNPEEDLIIFEKYKIYGTKWSKISSFLPGRTENSIKNRFYSTLRRIAYDYEKHLQNQEEKLNSANNNSINKSKTLPYQSKSSLNFLINFIDKAYEEKKRIYEKMNKKDNDLISSLLETKCNNSKSNDSTQSIDISKDNSIVLKDTLEIENELMNYNTSQMDIFEPEIEKIQSNINFMVKNYNENINNETSRNKTNSLFSDFNELEYNLTTNKYLLNDKSDNSNNNILKTNIFESNFVSCSQNEFDSLSSSSSYLPLLL